MSTALFIFRNDLRLHDNVALQKALDQFETVIPIYVFDPKEFSATRWGWKKRSARRALFLIETVSELKHNLQSKSSDLFVLHTPMLHALEKCKELFRPDAVFLSQEAAYDEIMEEQEVEKWCTSKGLRFFTSWNSTLAAIDALPFSISQLPDLFTSFRNKVERKGVFDGPIDEPASINSGPIPNSTVPTLYELGYEETVSFDKRSVLAFKGGESAALERLEEYIWKEEAIATYKVTRNGMVGANFSSKFSPWLALGALSARKIADEVWAFEEQIEKNESTYWMIFELLWRDFFRFTSLKQGRKLFLTRGFNGSSESHSKKELPRNWVKWSTGNTGDELVDANMRELLATGWMSNRGRQNVASYAIHEMQLPWVKCAAYFEHHLLDYDPCSNYGNWAYLAGVGNDARNDRKFNTKRQAEMYDADGSYRELWLD
jgi:deoxyribodipyrimidine photo-lyase